MSAFSFVDLIGPTDGPPTIRIRACIRTLRTDEGGRKSSIRSGYRPNHNFGAPEAREFYIGQVTVLGREAVQPGEICEAVVEFINAQGLAAHLVVGRLWRIQEGPRLVATAEVLEVSREA